MIYTKSISLINFPMSNKQPSQLISLHENGLYLLDPIRKISSKLDLPFTLPGRTEPVCILHCRGMLCLTLKGNNELAIWTPGSKEFKRIPMVIPGQTTNPLGFGYDQVSKDFKIVTIINEKTYIYAFKESSWRESVPAPPSLDCKFNYRTGTVVNHCMYWIADRSHIRNPPEVNTILCFDFVKEEYQELNFPMASKSEKFSSWLGVLNGDFCVIDHYPLLYNDIAVWRPEKGDKMITQWHSDPWINMYDNLEGSQTFDVGFACIAKENEVYIMVKGNENGEDKVMVYNRTQEKFTQIPFGSSLKGFRCMNEYICQ